MKYGFTGTRHGMTPRQRDALRYLFGGADRRDELHHGGCVGADADAHNVWAMYTGELPIFVYWSDRPAQQADLSLGNVYFEDMPAPPLVRNLVIVRACDMLIAAPRTLSEEVRSGTWHAVRAARKAGKPVLVLDP